MAQAGDLHWERQEAGVYETVFYANGYRYRIIKKDPYYDSKPRWYAYYRWHKTIKSDDKPLEWTIMRSTWSDTLKEAKEKCLKHNMRPRTKYKFMGRVTQEQIDEKFHRPERLGQLVFVAIDRDGKVRPYSTKYLTQEEYRPGKENELDEQEAS